MSRTRYLRPVMTRPEVELRETVLSDGIVCAELAPPSELRAQLVDALAESGLLYVEVAALDVGDDDGAARDEQALKCARILPERADRTFAAMVRRYEVYPLFRETALDAISIRLAVQSRRLARGWDLTEAALAVDRMELWMPEMVRGGYRARAVLVDGLQLLGASPGEAGERELEKLVEALLEEGIEEICIGDAIGSASPSAIRRAAKRWVALFGADKIGLRPCDALGRGLLQLCAGYEAGVRCFDVVLGGLGASLPTLGCAHGLATEDAVALLAEENISTGVDLRQLTRCARFAAERLGVSSRSRYAAACDSEGRPQW